MVNSEQVKNFKNTRNMNKKDVKLFTVPNIITLLNILSGFISIVFAFKGDLVISAYFIGLAAIFDFFDGFAARLLKSFSQIGKELDSLADVISFGLAPAIILYHLFNQALSLEEVNTSLNVNNLIYKILPYLSVIIVAFSALRLAKFNIDDRQTSSFMGLPTPANAIFIASLPVVLSFYTSSIISELILNKYFLIFLTIILSYLLIAEIPMFSLKFSNFSFKENKIRFMFIGISVILLVSLRIIAIPIIILIYILLSITYNIFSN